jgi:hypothetical protein
MRRRTIATRLSVNVPHPGEAEKHLLRQRIHARANMPKAEMNRAASAGGTGNII